MSELYRPRHMPPAIFVVAGIIAIGLHAGGVGLAFMNIRHTDQHRVCLHIERCGRQLLFRTLELELVSEASREHHTEHTP